MHMTKDPRRQAMQHQRKQPSWVESKTGEFAAVDQDREFPWRTRIHLLRTEMQATQRPRIQSFWVDATETDEFETVW